MCGVFNGFAAAAGAMLRPLLPASCLLQAGNSVGYRRVRTIQKATLTKA